MQNIELREEASVTPLEYGKVKRTQQKPVAKKIVPALADTPKELRKREAIQPLYLIRYE